jgi:thaumarchaeosortase
MRKRFSLLTNLLPILIVMFPILFALILDPKSFTLSWNEGRGGLLFAMALISAELIGRDVRKSTNRKRLIIIIILGAATCAYIASLDVGLKKFVVSIGPIFHVQLIDSWIWMLDFGVITFYVILSLKLLLGRHWYKIAPAGMVFLVGTTIILFLDAFFPYDSLGPLQSIVPIYLKIDEAIINFVNNHLIHFSTEIPATSRDNLLVLNGSHGPFALKVFWPSAGVHSMIIYSLIMLAFLTKVEMPLQRKLIYFAIGSIGTAAVNLIRLTCLSLFPLMITTNVNQWENFHSIAGEIMFIPWLGVYVLALVSLENKRFALSSMYSVAPSR